MKKVRLLYRLLSFIFCVLVLVLFSTFSALLIRNAVKRQKKISGLVRFLSSILMKLLGFKIKAEGLDYLQKNQNYLVVANHVGYIDITLIHSFIQNNCFITHYEWQENSPFLNLIAKKAGVYFVERRNLKNLRRELRDTTDILKKGHHLVFFPEGTSTDGSEVLPFHPPFFSTAVRAGKPILPVYIQYIKVEGENFSAKNKDLICWYDHTVSFTKHLFSLLQLKSIEAHIKFLSPIDSKGRKSRELAMESREQICLSKRLAEKSPDEKKHCHIKEKS